MAIQSGNHTTMFANVLSALMFFSPCVFFYMAELYFISLFYQFAIIFLLLVVVSHVKWEKEINKKNSPV